MPIFLQCSLVEDQLCLLLKIVHFENFDEKGKTFCSFVIFLDSVWMCINYNRFIGQFSDDDGLIFNPIWIRVGPNNSNYSVFE